MHLQPLPSTASSAIAILIGCSLLHFGCNADGKYSKNENGDNVNANGRNGGIIFEAKLIDIIKCHDHHNRESSIYLFRITTENVPAEYCGIMSVSMNKEDVNPLLKNVKINDKYVLTLANYDIQNPSELLKPYAIERFMYGELLDLEDKQRARP